MTANNSKSYLPYLNKLVDQHNNTYDQSINGKPVNADLNLKLIIKSELVSIRIYLVKLHWKLVKRNICFWFCFKN